MPKNKAVTALFVTTTSVQGLCKTCSRVFRNVPTPEGGPATMTTVPKARLADLAEADGVSTATVSRVLNNRPGVKADTREAVQAAAAALGYAAEKPGPRRPGPVAIMLPELSNPSFTAFAEILDTL